MSNWDNEIDIVAQQMTEGDSDAAFRARVLARIDAAGSRRRMGRTLLAWSPVAVAIVAIVAIVVVRSPSQPTPKVRLKADTTSARVDTAPSSVVSGFLTTDPSAEARRAKAEASAKAVRRTSVVAAGSEPRVVASGFSRTIGEATVAGVEDPDSLVPALLEIEPIRVETMETMESIEVPRLDVAPLEVPAISAEATTTDG